MLVNPSAYRWSDPQPGDVVHYLLPAQDVRMQGAGRYAAIYRLQGDRVDRILAKAGEQSDLRARGSCWSMDNLRRGCRWIPALPDGANIYSPGELLPDLPQYRRACLRPLAVASIVPRGQIWGRVYWRTPTAVAVRGHPLNRTFLMARFDKLEFNALSRPSPEPNGPDPLARDAGHWMNKADRVPPRAGFTRPR